MTDAQKKSVCELRDWLIENAGDSACNTENPNVSPRGDGRWVSLYEVWGRGNRSSAHRRNISLVWKTGELKAYEIAFVCGDVKLCPLDEISDTEHGYYFDNPSLPDSVRRARVECGYPWRVKG